MRTTTFALLLLPLLSAAEETYTIKLKIHTGVGETTTFSSKDTSTGSFKGFDAEGKVAFEIKKEGDEEVYRTTVLEADKEGKATKYIRVYEKATEKEDGEVKSFSFQGRTLLFEKVDGKFRVGVVGGKALDPKDAAKLIKDANKKNDSEAMFRALATGQPVKVGDSWDLPVKPIVASLDDMIADESKSSIKAKLVKVYDKGKSKFGTFEVKLRVAITGNVEDDGMTLKFKNPAIMEANLTIDAAIDASSAERKESGTVSFKGDGEMTLGGTTNRIVLDMSGDGVDARTAAIEDPKFREVPKVVWLIDPNEWTEFKPKDNSFSVQFPGGRPKEEVKKGDAATERRYQTELNGGLVAYSVVITEFPDPTMVDQKALLEAVAGSLKATIKSEKKIELNGFKGVEIVYEQESKGFTLDVTRQVFMVNGRAFELTVAALKGQKADPDKFFKSFKITEKAKKRDD